MNKLSLFETPLWITELDIDLNSLENKIRTFSTNIESSKLSNVGGYQGHNFHDESLFNSIVNCIPTNKDKPLKDVSIYSWVNINKKSNRNERHCHMHSDTLLSGVFYVKYPENSGSIRFYDPRGHLIQTQKDYIYYYDGYAYNYIYPKNNLLVLFPPWLEHDVEPNESTEDRISIAFNINAKY
ncbi:MAG: TIGR02466 family protein [Gammaproteobacteria bacterium]